MNYEFSLVLPVQNQADIISLVINQIVKILKKARSNYQLVVVENGSTDKTLSVLKQLARKNNRIKITTSLPGYGRAVVQGLNKAEGKYLGYMPSDGQCDATVLPIVLQAIQKKSVDLVKVYRTSRESWFRKYVSNVFNFLANILFYLKVEDINASPTVMTKKNYYKLNLESKDSFLDTELLIKAKYLNWNIIRVPMKNFNRIGGRSTVKPTIVFEFLKNMISWRFCGKL